MLFVLVGAGVPATHLRCSLCTLAPFCGDAGLSATAPGTSQEGALISDSQGWQRHAGGAFPLTHAGAVL